MKFNNLVAAAAAAGLALAPIAVQAGTRASSSAMSIGTTQAGVPASGQRKSAKVSADQKLTPEMIALLLALLGAAACGALCNGGGSNSPGV